MKSSIFATILLGFMIAVPTLRDMFGLPVSLYFVPILGMIIILFFRRESIFTNLVFGKKYIIFVCILFMWLIFSSFWTISEAQNNVSLLLIFSNSLLLLTVYMFGADKFVSRLPVIIVFISFIFACFIIISRYTNVDVYSANIIEFYLTVSSVIGLGYVLVISLICIDNRFTSIKVLIAAFILFGLSLSYARGAFLSSLLITLLSAIWMLLSRNRFSFGKKFVLSLAMISLILLSVYSAMSVERTAGRLVRIFEGSELEVGGRGSLWHTSWRNINESPFIGYGLGSHGLKAGTHEGGYPHNLFLQVLLDSGIIGLVLLIIVCFLPVYSFYKLLLLKNTPVGIVGIFYMYTFMLLEFSKSSNFYTARIFFVFGYFIVYYYDKYSANLLDTKYTKIQIKT